ncbi:MAG: FHA domain-containing protein, partial [Tepidiformaceae bacterium]
ALTHAPFSIGRGPGNDLVLTSLSVSRNHAEIVRDGENLVLRDLESRNGVSVGGERYSSVKLADGLVVSVGDVALRIEMRP